MPNEGKRNPRGVKASGITAGVSDVLVFDARAENITQPPEYYGLAIELKIHPNKPTKTQLAFQKKLIERGWHTKVCYSFDEAKEIIDWYLKK